VNSHRKLHPALGAQVSLAEDQDDHQRPQSGDVHPVNLFEQGVIVQQADGEHDGNATCNPVELLDVRSGKLGVFGGAVDFVYTQPANDEYEQEQ